jgi:hypothetical protein
MHNTVWTDPWLVIPTAGKHPDLLAGIIAKAGIPAARIILVVTGEFARFRLLTIGAGTYLEAGPGVNIHRWWNLGIEHAVSCGAEHVAVLNDDVEITDEVIPAMSLALTRTGSTLCYVDASAEVTGWAWMLNTSHGLRPDELFRWYFGDNDMDLRAKRDHHGVCGVQVDIKHLHPSEATQASPELRDLIRVDEATFKERWTPWAK